MSESKGNPSCNDIQIIDNSEMTNTRIKRHDEKQLLTINLTLDEMGAHDAACEEKDISEIVKLAGPISPMTAVQRNDVVPPSDDEAPKVILNLVTAAQYNSEDEQKKLAQDQLEELNMNSHKKRKNKVFAVASNKEKRGQGIDNGVTNDDLVAILEGNNEGHYEIVTISSEGVNQENSAKPDESNEVPKPRGRRRKTNPMENAHGKIPTNLINSFCTDWNEYEKELEIIPSPVTKKSVKRKNPPASAPEVHRSSRVIKKKIIWDPDAPETQISYASLVQSSTKKRKEPPTTKTVIRPATPKKAEEPDEKTLKTVKAEPKEESSPTTQKRRSETPIVLIKKKRQLETEKLSNNKGTANVLKKGENDEAGEDTKERPVELVIRKGDTILKKLNVNVKNATGKTVTSKELPSKKELLSTKKEILNPKKQAASPVLQTRRGRVPLDEDSKTEAPLPKKRIPKPKKDNWDFVYNQRNVDSMIIRRRSSSYSSASPRRLSLDHPGATVQAKTRSEKQIASNKKVNTGRGKGFEFVKPETKSTKKEVGKEPSDNSTKPEVSLRESPRKSGRIPVLVIQEVNTDQSKTVNVASTEKTSSIMVSVELKRHESVTQITVHTKSSKIMHSYTVQMLKDLAKILEVLSKDKSCKVVIFTADGPNFCNGIDFSSMVITNVEKRRHASQEMAKSVSDFLKALASFPKPIIAGVHGSCVGLGVTMLPLFDVVISSDKSTFETSYARNGQLPEGYSVLTLTNNVRHNFKTKLLWLCEQLDSTEAALSGLVTKLTPPARVQSDTLKCATKLALSSSQTLTVMKSLRFKTDISKLLVALNDEEAALASHWASPECQEKFKQYLQMDN